MSMVRKRNSRSGPPGGTRKKRAPANAPKSSAAKRKTTSHSKTRQSTSRKKPAQKRRASAAKSSRKNGTSYLRSIAYWGAVAAIWGGVIITGLVAYFSLALPDPQVAGLNDRPPNITILAANGTVLAERGMRRDHVRLSYMPKHLISAVLTTEDRRFYNHFGIDPVGLARAIYHNSRAGNVVQGGSTITQQLAKNLFLKSDRTFLRKFQEAALAIWLEYKFSKNKILELYLNRVYFGAGAYGVEAASQRYFGKSVRNVTISEAALLAGLLKAPSRYAPTNNAKLAARRSRVVLKLMHQSGALSAQSYRAARRAPARLRKWKKNNGTDYVLDWVSELLPGFVGRVSNDLIIETTISPTIQRDAYLALTQLMEQNGPSRNAKEAAAIILDRTGAIKGLIGGRSYKRSQFNRAVKAKRQPGSAFKPFVYLAAIESGMTPHTVLYDKPIKIKDWRPKNNSKRYLGAITMRESLARSVNTVAVRLLLEAGRWRVVRTARRLGIHSELHRKPSLALGTAEVSLLELTAAYTPFANGGYGVVPHIIRRVKDRSGKILYERSGTGPGRIISHPYVGAMNDMMRATIHWGTGRTARIAGLDVAGKTGTTQNFRDGWFIGYSAQLIGGVWVGNDDGSAMKKVTGGGLPAQIWRQMMVRAHRTYRKRLLPGANTIAATNPYETSDASTPNRPPAESSSSERPSSMRPSSEPIQRLDENFIRRVLRASEG